MRGGKSVRSSAQSVVRVQAGSGGVTACDSGSAVVQVCRRGNRALQARVVPMCGT